MPPPDSGPAEAERFFQSLAPDLDTTDALRWGYMLEGAAEDRVGPLTESLAGMGFHEVEPMLDEAQEGRYILCFAEVCAHTAESFARRVALVEQFAAREGLRLSDYSAGREE